MVAHNKLEARFNRANISKGDFDESETYLSSYRTRLPDPIRRAILVAAIVAYARPFTRNEEGREKRSTPSLAVSPPKLLTTKELALHKKIINLRNEAVAHSDYDRKPTRRIFGTRTGFLAGNRPFDVLSEGINVQTFRSMAKKMRNHCIDTLFKLNRELPTENSEP